MMHSDIVLILWSLFGITIFIAVFGCLICMTSFAQGCIEEAKERTAAGERLIELKELKISKN